jgi:PTS system fructose-specific IIA component
MSVSIGLSVLDSSLYIPELRPKRKESVLHEMVTRAHRGGAVRDPELLLEIVCLRERLGATSIGKGVAIPNARSLAVLEPKLVVARSHRGVEWDAADGSPVHLVFLALSPAEQPVELHHEFIARIVAVGRLQRQRQKLLDAADYEAAEVVLREVGP